MPDAAVTSFAVVFSLFVVVTAVLLVLVLRFTLQRAAVARARWLADSADDPEPGAEEEDDDRELTALVLGGGGTRGAVQIGMLQVLTEHGFVPDRIYGSSVGAVNGVAFAGDPTRAGVERMTEIWTGLTRDAVYPQGRLHGPWLYFQQRDSVYPNTGLRKVVEEGIDFERLEDAVIPVEVVATSLTDGQERWFTYGSAVEAVLASTAVPAIFPPVEIDGERFIDGGVVNNVPIRRAIEAGATRIVVLLCGPPVYTPASPRRPVEAMLNALFISIHARFARDMAQLPPGVEVIVCSGSAEGTRDFDDFSTTESLIAQGREEASEVVRRYGLGVPGTFAEATGPGRPDLAPGSTGRHRSVRRADPAVPDGRRLRSTATEPIGSSVRHRGGHRRRAGAARHPTRAGDVAAHHAGRHAGDDAVVGEGAPDHRSGADHHVLPELGAREDHHAGSQPAAAADQDRDVAGPLGVHHLVRILVAVVLVGDVDVGPGVDVVSDLHLEVADDVAAPADHAPVADADHRDR